MEVNLPVNLMATLEFYRCLYRETLPDVCAFRNKFIEAAIEHYIEWLKQTYPTE